MTKLGDWRVQRRDPYAVFQSLRLQAEALLCPAANLNWLVNEKGIAPHIPVIDKSKRDDGTFSREDFTFDKACDVYVYPAGEVLGATGTVSADHASAT